MKEEYEEKLLVTDKANKMIADETAAYLKSRILITQDIMKNEGIVPISFSDFVKTINSFDEKDFGGRRKYYKENIGRILFNQEEIEEIVNITHESIYFFNTFNSSFDYAFSHIIQNIVDNYYDETKKNLEEEKKYGDAKKISKLENELQKAEKWKTVSYVEENFWIDSRIEGRLSFGYIDRFDITDSNRNLVCVIGFDGTDIMAKSNRHKVDEDILLKDNLYFGVLRTKSKKLDYTVLLKKNIEGTEMIKDVCINEELYHTDEKESEKVYASPIESFNSFLDRKGLSFLKDNLYTKQQFVRIKHILSYIKDISNEDLDKIDRTSKAAAEWWANAIKKPTFNNGDLKASLFATLMSNKLLEPKEDKIEKFKEYLFNEIKAELIFNYHNGYAALRVDYEPDDILTRAAKKANLNTDIMSFPWKTTMEIRNYVVNVKKGYGENKQVIFDANVNPLKTNEEPVKELTKTMKK